MANSNKSDLALQMYEKALELRPHYVRGWLNKGIAYANLNRYEESAIAYLSALHLNRNAKHIWNYIRVVLTCMDRLDLVELAGNEDITALSEALGLNLSNI